MGTDTAEGRRAGPRRSEMSRQAIQSAVREELVEHGWRSFSVDRVAKRASASKQTIYRWWPSIAALCVESVLSEFPERRLEADTVVGRIAEIVQPIVSFARSNSGQPALRGACLAASDDKEARELIKAWVAEDIRGPLRHVLAELAVKGVIRRDWQAEDAIAHLLGPIWHRIVIMNAPLTDAHAKIAAEDLIRALGPLPQL